mmetsp:Transcript_19331/g.27978  ORF Transcript_19331/g.27978 Transcript_19331/m.27978 type:complete len:161 (-) Transcript_19331:197-679(-)
MSRPPYQTYPHHHPHNGRPYIEVNDHDILCGRGVNIASHPGNERFRALVQTRHDENYCTVYTTSEKRAVAEQILKHIQSLDPPGRFLKRIGRAPTSRGLQGPWEEPTDREAIKKTCQDISSMFTICSFCIKIKELRVMMNSSESPHCITKNGLFSLVPTL